MPTPLRPRPHVAQVPFGAMPDGRRVDAFELRNASIEVVVLTLGGIIASVRVPDRSGRLADVVLGYDALEPYLAHRAYLGAIVGRYANRIANGRFRLDGTEVQLARNDGAHHLHGGITGFDRQIWEATALQTDHEAGVSLSRLSPPGEERYPGGLSVKVTYVLTAEQSFTIAYEAMTDAPTVLNLTQHTYFNLDGSAGATILDHDLTLGASHYTPVDAGLIPTGEVAPVAGTAFDFTVRRRLGHALALNDAQLRLADGIDHNFVLDCVPVDGRAADRRVARLEHSASGRVLHISTSEPGIQIYCGQQLDGTHGARGRVFGRYAGVCLETQHFPDSPNQPQFPAVALYPGELFQSSTTWHFGTV